jgi:FkbM family methyltransferase
MPKITGGVLVVKNIISGRTRFPPLKELVRHAFTLAGFRVTRIRPANRFQAMDESLLLLRSLGFAPRVVIDTGANTGTWARMCQTIYPSAVYYLIEPQPAYADRLRGVVQELPNAEFHCLAVTEPGIRSVRMCGAGSSGAWVAMESERGCREIVCPAVTLDELLAARIRAEDRALLTLDLEGHELAVLAGAKCLLEALEVVLPEVRFYSVSDYDRSTFGDMFEFFRENDFDLFDIASLSQRPKDMRLRMGDVIFVRRKSSLFADRSWD